MRLGSTRSLVLAVVLALLAFGGEMLATGAGAGREAAARVPRSATPPRARVRGHRPHPARGGFELSPHARAHARRGPFSLHRCARRRHRCNRRRHERAGSADRAPTSAARGAIPAPTSSPTPSAGSPTSAGAGSGQPTSAGAPSAAETPSTPSGPPRVQVLAKEYSLTLSRSEVPAGKVIVEFVNGGEDPHNLHLEEPTAESEAGAFPTSAPKAHLDLTLELKPGSYTLFCALPEHEAKGMKATLTVH